MPKSRNERLTYTILIASLLAIVGWRGHHILIQRRFTKALWEMNTSDALIYLRRGADPNTVVYPPDTDRRAHKYIGTPALEIACDKLDEELVRELLARGAMVNQPDESTRQPPLSMVAQAWERWNPQIHYTQRTADEVRSARRRAEVIIGMLRAHGATMTAADAVTLGDIGALRQRLDAGDSPNQRSAYGSLLMHAIFIRNKPIVDLLLARGADVNGINNFNPPLSTAIQVDDETLVRTLLAHGANPNVRTSPTPLEAAVDSARRNPKMLKLLLDRGADVNGRDSMGRTALLYAVDVADKKTIHFLLDRGANLREKDNTGNTALHSAASLADGSILEEFIRRGLDVNATDTEGITPLMCAAATTQYITDHPIKSMVGVAATTTSIGIPVTTVLSGPTGSFPPAPLRRSNAALRILLAHGANVHARTRRGNTALLWAISAGNEEAVQLLLERGASVLATGTSGTTALLRAVQGHNTRLVTLLLKHGAAVNTPDNSGMTPLYAATLTDANMALLLLAHGANPNAALENGDTPLMRAAVGARRQLVAALLVRGANAGARRRDGETAMSLARKQIVRLPDRHGVYAEIINLLTKAGATN